MTKKRGMLMQVFIVGMLTFVLLGSGRISLAQAENPLGLSSSVYYDVYIGAGDEGVSVIRNVKVVDVREISGVLFLVINTDIFKQSRSEGLVALAHVHAILPTARFINTPQ